MASAGIYRAFGWYTPKLRRSRPAPAKAKPAPRERRTPKEPRSWRCIVQGSRKPFAVRAHTKSEARALAKAHLGIKGRLPLGSVVDAA